MIALALASATCLRTLLGVRAFVRVPCVFSCFPLLDFAGTAIDALTINGRTQRLSADRAAYNIQIMKITKNIGMLLLAIYLIVDGLLGFGLHLGPAIFLLYLVALAAGICILIGK